MIIFETPFKTTLFPSKGAGLLSWLTSSCELRLRVLCSGLNLNPIIWSLAAYHPLSHAFLYFNFKKKEKRAQLLKKRLNKNIPSTEII